MSLEAKNTKFVTEDGSHSLHSARFGVSYHSTHGAVRESEHVFIDAGLRQLLDSTVKDIRILEMGFGTGLNALLVMKISCDYPEKCFHYLTFERFPLGSKVIQNLNYPALVGVHHNRFLQLHSCDWNAENRLGSNFNFTKFRHDFLTEEAHTLYPQRSIDVIFYDAFAPVSQPEFWEPQALRRCHRALKPGGALVTYCAKGQFKRDLRSVGFSVEALPGPPGKREMTRATVEGL